MENNYETSAVIISGLEKKIMKQSPVSYSMIF